MKSGELITGAQEFLEWSEIIVRVAVVLGLAVGVSAGFKGEADSYSFVKDRLY
jgi:hypothetical protein